MKRLVLSLSVLFLIVVPKIIFIPVQVSYQLAQNSRWLGFPGVSNYFYEYTISEMEKQEMSHEFKGHIYFSYAWEICGVENSARSKELIFLAIAEYKQTDSEVAIRDMMHLCSILFFDLMDENQEEEAIQFFKECRQKLSSEELSEAYLEMLLHSEWGRHCYSNENQMKEHYEKATEIAEREKFQGDSVANIFWNYADYLDGTGSFKEAEVLLRKALEVADPNSKTTVKCYHSLGVVLGHLNRYHEAIEQHYKELEVLSEEDDFERIDAYNSIAWRYYLLGDAENALHHSQILIELLDKGMYLDSLRNCAYDTIACAYDLNGEMEKAEEYSKMSVEKVSFLGGKSRASRYRTLGNIYEKQGKKEEARKAWEDSFRWFISIGDRESAKEIKEKINQL